MPGELGLPLIKERGPRWTGDTEAGTEVRCKKELKWSKGERKKRRNKSKGVGTVEPLRPSKH